MVRILVIDDDEQFCDLLCTMFRRVGYDAMYAFDGLAGLKIMRQKGADLIITDIFMPGMRGTELIMDIKAEFSGTKIIAISGGGNVKDVDFLELAQNLGASKTFQKPFENKEILEAVTELLI